MKRLSERLSERLVELQAENYVRPLFDNKPSLAVPKKPTLPTTSSDSRSSEFVRNDFVWFKCKSCGERKTVKNGWDKQLFLYFDAYGPRTKWCKDCVAEAAHVMGIEDQDLKNASKRIVLRGLEKNGND